MTKDTRELIARALRRGAEGWDSDASKGFLTTPEGKPGQNLGYDARDNMRRDASFARGFAEALENGCNL